MRTAYVLALVGLAASSVPATAQKKISQKEISRELREMEEEEQREQARWESMSDAEFTANQKRRRDRARQIVDAGQLAKTEDFYNAGMLLQHGQSADDFLLAHILGTIAALDEDAGAKFLSAAALDRFLMSLGQPQYFSSQYGDEEGKQPVEPFDDTLSQTVVSIFGERSSRGGLRGRDVDPAHRKKKELKAASKEIEKLAKSTLRMEERRRTDPQAIVDAVLERVVVKGYVREGKLDDEDDFFNAAIVFSAGETDQDLALAHILTTAAAIEGHEEAPAMYAETLDRLLVELNRAPLFGTQEVRTAEGLTSLHENLKKPLQGKGKRR